MAAQSIFPSCRWQELYDDSQIACDQQEFQLPHEPEVNNVTFSANSFVISPNPGRNRVTLNFKEGIKVEGLVIVKNIYGRELLRQPATQSDMDISALSPGLYLLEWYKEGELLATQKFVRL